MSRPKGADSVRVYGLAKACIRKTEAIVTDRLGQILQQPVISVIEKSISIFDSMRNFIRPIYIGLVRRTFFARLCRDLRKCCPMSMMNEHRVKIHSTQYPGLSKRMLRCHSPLLWGIEVVCLCWYRILSTVERRLYLLLKILAHDKKGLTWISRNYTKTDMRQQERFSHRDIEARMRLVTRTNLRNREAVTWTQLWRDRNSTIK